MSVRSTDNRIVSLDDFEHRLIVGSLNNYRNHLIVSGKPTEDLNELILKLINAPHTRAKQKTGRDYR